MVVQVGDTRCELGKEALYLGKQEGLGHVF